MKHKQNKYIYILIVILYVVYYFFEESENYTTSINLRTLEKDGFCVLYNPQYIKTISEPCIKLQEDVLSHLPDGYVFMDYIYKINDGALSTFHRDVTSSKTIYKTDYPVYTLILYKYEGDLLSVCPNSNATHPFVGSRIVNVEGKAGTCFLFDCDLLHAGCTNYCKERHVIQYKLCHQQDIHKLSHLQGIRNEKNDVCSLTLYNSMMRKLSYYFQLPINSILYPLMIKRENKKTIIGKIQSFIPIKYYNNV
uniref:Prolyl 4-hydroxylase alpha subunit Fe(2+) 2OG dioxygenase domain-containing protein n=1 Tax=viral metagenome TaxID=1070528 RepID=A0A6C0B8Z2_9ZZZZ